MSDDDQKAAPPQKAHSTTATNLSQSNRQPIDEASFLFLSIGVCVNSSGRWRRQSINQSIVLSIHLTCPHITIYTKSKAATVARSASTADMPVACWRDALDVLKTHWSALQRMLVHCSWVHCATWPGQPLRQPDCSTYAAAVVGW